VRVTRIRVGVKRMVVERKSKNQFILFIKP
jgi:hypothetical protein